MKLSVFLTGAVLIFSAFTLSAAQKEHTVQRGETLASIAKSYNVSVDDILEANPDAKNLFFTGMVLVIPEASAAQQNVTTPFTTPVQPEVAETSNNYSNNVLLQGNNTTSTSNENGPGFGVWGLFEYGFIPKVKGVSGSNLAFSIAFGANYYILEKNNKLFAGIGIGYNTFSFNNTARIDIGEYSNSKTDAHCIYVPVKIGYSFKTNNRKFGITPLIGLDINGVVGEKRRTRQSEARNMKIAEK